MNALALVRERDREINASYIYFQVVNPWCANENQTTKSMLSEAKYANNIKNQQVKA